MGSSITDERIPARLRDRISETEGGCWSWAGMKTWNGYGAIKTPRQKGQPRTDIRIHRLVYTELVGEIPSDLCLDHLCRNRLCCNPDHLELVTLAENTIRGRIARGGGRNKCARGHEFTSENTYNRRDGQRECRKCRNAAAKAFKARQKVEA